MCKSQADGGQRCAAHTRAKFEAAEGQLMTSSITEDPHAKMAARMRWEAAAAEYASTREGRLHFDRTREACERNGRAPEAVLYGAILSKGDRIRAANREAARTVRGHVSISEQLRVEATRFAAMEPSELEQAREVAVADAARLNVLRDTAQDRIQQAEARVAETRKVQAEAYALRIAPRRKADADDQLDDAEQALKDVRKEAAALWAVGGPAHMANERVRLIGREIDQRRMDRVGMI